MSVAKHDLTLRRRYPSPSAVFLCLSQLPAHICCAASAQTDIPVMRAWCQEASQALMFLANYSKKKGDFAEAEQCCATFRNLSHFVLVLADNSCSHAVFTVACFASSPFCANARQAKICSIVAVGDTRSKPRLCCETCIRTMRMRTHSHR